MVNKTQNDHSEEENLEESVIEDEVVKLRQELEDTELKYKRALADYSNLQKRSREERVEWARSANKDLLLRILVVLDTLMLAYQHIQDANLKVSIQQFLDVLKAEGVTKIETVGQDFDPNLMEAISSEAGEEGKVLTEMRSGFMIHEKLLRAAQVTVGNGESN